MNQILNLMEHIKMDQTIKCAGCGRNFVYTDKEEAFLKGLVAEGKLAEFVVPRRCLTCRQKKRREMKVVAPPAKAVVPSSVPSVASPAPHPYVQSAPPSAPAPLLSMPAEDFIPGPMPSAPPAPPAPIAPLPAKEMIFEGKPPQIIRDEEIRIVLASDDFEKLVCREEVLWSMGNKKVRIILADIGFPAMKAALQKAMLQWLKS